MKCGCGIDSSTGYTDGDYLDEDYCLFPEAVEIIKKLVLASAWHGSKVNQEAEAFLEKVHAQV